MTPTAQPSRDKRSEALSRSRIVEAAVEILDTSGEAALTFRALASHLSTGAGAIYWHVANKSELLAAATEAVLVPTWRSLPSHATPDAAIRGMAVSMFRAMDEHPWIGPQLSRSPWQDAMLRIFELLGQQLQRAGVPADKQFGVASALVFYIVGAGAQNALNAQQSAGEASREDMLDAMASRWATLDVAEYPFVHSIAAELSDHDDEEQFAAGVDVFLRGIAGL